MMFFRPLARMTSVSLLLSLLFFSAGFSQVDIGGIRPVDLIIVLTFIIFILKGNLKLGFFYLFFCFSFFYAWVIGGAVDAGDLFSNIVIFSIAFSIIDYFKYRDYSELEYYLKLFTYSMFLSNSLALIVFLFVPQLKENVVDISSIGVRFRGFFSQANGYAYVLLLNLPIAIYFLKMRRNVFNVLNVIIVIFCLVMAQSRGAILSFLVGIVCVYIVFLLRSGKVLKIIFPTIIFLAVSYVALLVLPNILEVKFGINLSRLNPTAEKSSERNISDLSLSDIKDDRFYLVNAGIQTIQTFPLGLGYQPQHEVIGKVTGVYFIPHNYFLTLLLTYGIFIGSIWIFIIMFLVMKGVKLVYKNRVTPNNIFFYLAGMVIMVSVFYLTHSSDWSFLYILVSFFVIYCRIRIKEFSLT